MNCAVTLRTSRITPVCTSVLRTEVKWLLVLTDMSTKILDVSSSSSSNEMANGCSLLCVGVDKKNRKLSVKEERGSHYSCPEVCQRACVRNVCVRDTQYHSVNNYPFSRSRNLRYETEPNTLFCEESRVETGFGSR